MANELNETTTTVDTTTTQARADTTTQAKATKSKSVVYNDAAMPQNINDMRANLLAFAQAQICGLKASDLESEKPVYRFQASMSKYGLGGRAIFWPTGETINAKGEKIPTLFEVVVAIRAIRETTGERGFSAKLKADAEAVLFKAKYDELIADAVSKGKKADVVIARNPYAKWVGQQRNNMIEKPENTPEVNAANKARAEKWALLVNAKCAELAQAQADAKAQAQADTDEDDIGNIDL